MKLISWNVNGLRAALTHGFESFIDSHAPDILCLQETKLGNDGLLLNLPEYTAIWNNAKKAGYAGTAILTKKKPLQVSFGLNSADDEGRVITAEFSDFYLINVYTPNSQRGLTRLALREKWDGAFLKYIMSLDQKKPVVFCGDLNVAHEEIDIARPKDNRRNAGFTDEERAGFARILHAGFIDTFRMYHKEGGQYSWWSYMFNARAKNIGWRIDYFCISERLKTRLKEAFILQSVHGSDHCPVGIVIT